MCIYIYIFKENWVHSDMFYSDLTWQLIFFSFSLVTSSSASKKHGSYEQKTVYLLIYSDLVWTWRRRWYPTPGLLPGKSHGWRSLVSCGPWECYKLDTTERLHFHFSLSCIGEGNGNPLQCSCLKNPRDRGAWRAAVYGSYRVGHDWSDLAAAAAAH